MPAGNFQFEQKQAFVMDKKVVAAAYTARTGRTTDDFKFDNPIDVADPTADFTLTVPSGSYMGQELLVVMSSNASSKTCSISVTNHETSDPEVFTMDAVDEYLFMIWTGTEYATISGTVTT